ERGDADGADLVTGGLWHGIGGDQLLDRRIFQPLVAQLAENRMGDAGENAPGTAFREDFRRRAERAGGFGHVVDKEDVAALDLADYVHRFHAGGADTVLGDDREFGTERVGVGAGHFDAAHVRRDDREVGG